MKKLNWKSVLPLAITIFLPVIQPKLKQVGVQIAPAFFFPALAVFSAPLDFALLFPLIQAGTVMIGGLLANGAFERSIADFKTNILGIVGALFVLLGAFGLHFNPTVQESVGAFVSLLIVTFSAHPEHSELLKPTRA